MHFICILFRKYYLEGFTYNFMKKFHPIILSGTKKESSIYMIKDNWYSAIILAIS